MTLIQNPVLSGFNPDPSICRVDKDFYIANSTFEWFPGVQIHHSRDLVHWRLVTRPLTRASQLDMIGDPDSGGVWAPCLTWADGKFWLVYSDVKTRALTLMNVHNYVITASAIEGPWSEPVYLNSSGFDPSLFHDDDGRKWVINMLTDFRIGRNVFGGILLQEYEPGKGLVGPLHNIFKGTELRVTEGPHLYKRNGWYYLMTAEGGTGYRHAVTMARSRRINGPYEVDPENPMLSAFDKDCTLQKAGHASLVELDNGDLYLAHLCSRPVWQRDRRYSILGRETALQKCTWRDDGWLRLADGGNTPQDEVEAPDLPPHPFEPAPVREEFDAPDLPLAFQTLRAPAEASWASLMERPGWLRLYGRESTISLHRQSLVARRIESFRCEASTCLEFAPTAFQQMAGLIAYYGVKNHDYAFVTHDEDVGRCLKVIRMENGRYSEPIGTGVPVEPGPIFLKVSYQRTWLQFGWSADGVSWRALGPRLSAVHLSDEFNGSFTGAFVGICCQDLLAQCLYADFDWFEYRDF